MKTAMHGLLRVDRDLTVQPQTRLRKMETENCILTFYPPFPLSTDSVSFGPRTQSLSIVHRSITLHAHAGTSCEAFTWLRSKISWNYLTDQLWDRRLSTPIAPKALKEARRCRSVRKLLFLLARAWAKCGRNGPSMQTHGGIRVRQTPKVLQLCSSFGRAGKTKFALKWVGRTDRARNKALWTHLGRCWCINASVTCDPSSE